MVATVKNIAGASAKEAAHYFRKDANYYAKDDPEHRKDSCWRGSAARALGLRGQVAAEKFVAILEGRVPKTDIRLGRLVDGEHRHRAGFDITMSAPKSVSLAALLHGDDRVIRAHDRAVLETLAFIEETLLQTRGHDRETGRRDRVKADGMVVATFRHLASRELDPQLHTHCVIANMTRDAAGRWRSVEPTLLHRNARLIGAFYRRALALRLQRLGYVTRPTLAGRMPAFEIAGYDRRTIMAFSRRRQQVTSYIRKRGWTYSAVTAQAATLATRKRKAERPLEELQADWRVCAAQLGVMPEWTVPKRRRRKAGASTVAGPTAAEAVWQAVDHLQERRSVFRESEILTYALGMATEECSYETVLAAIDRLREVGHLIAAPVARGGTAYTTDSAVRAERDVVARMRRGIGRGPALADAAAAEEALGGSGLTRGQQDAVRMILLSEHRIVGVQGHAGSGKTTMLRTAAALAGRRPVIGLAPSAAATRVLESEARIPARTLQWFLTRCRGAGDGSLDRAGLQRLRQTFGGAVLVLDEASMVGALQMAELMRIAKGLGVARLVLAGDARQLRAVDAGQPFRQLQDAGMPMAVMDEILRQRDADLKAAVEAVLARQPGEALERLGDRVHEVASGDLGEAAGLIWLRLSPEHRAETDVVAPTHAMRARINATIRDGLAAEGLLRGQEIGIERLIDRGMTGAQKADIRNWHEGDAVVFRQDILPYRVTAGEVCTITGVADGRVLLRTPAGGRRHLVPMGRIRHRLDIYGTAPLRLRRGDRIRWTRNDRRRGLVNGGTATVTRIDAQRVHFEEDGDGEDGSGQGGGRRLSLTRDDLQLRFIDHAWSKTSHGAQGGSRRGIIAALDSGAGSLTDQRMFYVDISRARDHAVVLTDNAEQLADTLEAQTGERLTAREATGEMPVADARLRGRSEWASLRYLAARGGPWRPEDGQRRRAAGGRPRDPEFPETRFDAAVTRAMEKEAADSRRDWDAHCAEAAKAGRHAIHYRGAGMRLERMRRLSASSALLRETRTMLAGILAEVAQAQSDSNRVWHCLEGLHAGWRERQEGVRAAVAGGGTFADGPAYGTWRAPVDALLEEADGLLADGDRYSLHIRHAAGFADAVQQMRSAREGDDAHRARAAAADARIVPARPTPAVAMSPPEVPVPEPDRRHTAPERKIGQRTAGATARAAGAAARAVRRIGDAAAIRRAARRYDMVRKELRSGGADGPGAQVLARASEVAALADLPAAMAATLRDEIAVEEALGAYRPVMRDFDEMDRLAAEDQLAAVTEARRRALVQRAQAVLEQSALPEPQRKLLGATVSAEPERRQSIRLYREARSPWAANEETALRRGIHPYFCGDYDACVAPLRAAAGGDPSYRHLPAVLLREARQAVGAWDPVRKIVREMRDDYGTLHRVARRHAAGLPDAIRFVGPPLERMKALWRRLDAECDPDATLASVIRACIANAGPALEEAAAREARTERRREEERERRAEAERQRQAATARAKTDAEIDAEVERRAEALLRQRRTRTRGRSL